MLKNGRRLVIFLKLIFSWPILSLQLSWLFPFASLRRVSVRELVPPSILPCVQFGTGIPRSGISPWVARVPLLKAARSCRLKDWGLLEGVCLIASCIHCGKDCFRCQAKSKIRKMKMSHYRPFKLFYLLKGLSRLFCHDIGVSFHRAAPKAMASPMMGMKYHQLLEDFEEVSASFKALSDTSFI